MSGLVTLNQATHGGRETIHRRVSVQFELDRTCYRIYLNEWSEFQPSSMSVSVV